MSNLKIETPKTITEFKDAGKFVEAFSAAKGAMDRRNVIVEVLDTYTHVDLDEGIYIEVDGNKVSVLPFNGNPLIITFG